MRRTIDHPLYKPLNKEDTKTYFKKANINATMSLDLIQDVISCTAYSVFEEDGTLGVMPKEILKETVRAHPEYRTLGARLYRHSLKIREFLSNIPWEYVPGSSPMIKAANLIKLISANSNNSFPTTRNQSKLTIEDSQSEDQVMNKEYPLCEPINTKDTCDEIHESEKGRKAGLRIEDIIDIGKHLVYNKNSAIAKFIELEGNNKITDFSSLTTQQLKILNNISLLKQKTKIAYKKGTFYEENPFSKEQKMLKMEKFSDITKTSLITKEMPLFEEKFLRKDIYINKKVDKFKKKQELVMLIDHSGSMLTVDKQCYVKSVLINRLTAVMEGYANVYVGSYVESIFNMQKISTKEEALEYFKNYHCAGGGTTDIQGVLTNLVSDIKSGMIGEYPITSSPEILIVNDGRHGLDI